MVGCFQFDTCRSVLVMPTLRVMMKRTLPNVLLRGVGKWMRKLVWGRSSLGLATRKRKRRRKRVAR